MTASHVTPCPPPAEGNRYRLIGSTASPYALKLRAVLRYRRIPFEWTLMTRAWREALQNVKPHLIPFLQCPKSGEIASETTTLIHRLEQDHVNGRSVLPPDAASRFICDLIEDMADELAVKCLFFYRWWDPADQEYVSRWAAEEWSTSVSEPGSDAEAREFRDRQVSRMQILGATAENQPMLELLYTRMLQAFEPHVGMNRFLFGSRPSVADFAWYGQFSELAIDPTPMEIMRRIAPRTEVWARRLDDASGVEGHWDPDAATSSSLVRDLLTLAGDFYLPFLQANELAWREEKNTLELQVLGERYRLSPFTYQVRCWERLKSSFATLDQASQQSIKQMLDETGCLQFFLTSP